MTDALKPCPFCGSAPGTLARPDNIDGPEFYAAVFCHCEGYSATAHAGRRCKTQDEATSAAHAAWNRRAPPAAPPVPAGMVLVPVEPTIEMQIAGQEAWMLTHANRPSVEDCKQAIVTYHAMLAATQPVPATGAQPAPAAVPAWQPIETAPKDGSLFLGWVAAERWSAGDGACSSYPHDTSQLDFCWWRPSHDDPEAGYFDSGAGQIGDSQAVTHWMPLPAAPQQAPTGGAE